MMRSSTSPPMRPPCSPPYKPVTGIARLAAMCALLLAAACTTAPPAPPPPPPPENQVDLPVPPATIVTPGTSEPFAAPIVVDPTPFFVTIPGWADIDPRPGLVALKRSCDRITSRSDDARLLSSRAPWAGTIGEWRPLCASLEAALDAETARQVIESRFVPVEIVDPAAKPRFTGYFEPVIDARRRPEGIYTAPIPGPPDDLIADGVERYQRLSSGRTRPYPPRADIVPDPDSVLGYAHPADVFFLQIQGSGRLVFDDGSTLRAAYHAHNGHRFKSTANWLLAQGEISQGEASMQGIRAWMDRTPTVRVQQAMNANPRYVFFEAQPIIDPTLGPAGAEGIPLTRLGSMAVDPEFHAYGVPYVVETEAPGLGGLWRGVVVAQDTGGAIKGPVRGDIFFGTGDQAGRNAGTMNAPGRKWALLPPKVAERLKTPTPPSDAVPVAP